MTAGRPFCETLQSANLMGKRKGSYRLVGELHVPLPHSFLLGGGPMRALAHSIGLGAIARHLRNWEGGLEELMRSLIWERLESMLEEERGEGLDKLLGLLWLTPSGRRTGVLSVVTGVLRRHPDWAADPRAGELVDWLRDRADPQGWWPWLMGEQRAIRQREFEALAKESREEAMVLWLLDLRGTGWGGERAAGKVPRVLRAGLFWAAETLSTLAARFVKEGREGLRLEDWEGFGTKVVDELLMDPGWRQALVHPEDLERLGRQTVRLGERWLRVHGNRFYDVGAAIAAVGRRHRHGAAIPWEVCLDSGELRNGTVQALLGNGETTAVVPSLEEICDAVSFVMGSSDEKRRRFRMGGPHRRRVPLGLTAKSDWEEVFDDVGFWDAGKGTPAWLAGEIGSLGWEWVRDQIEAGAGVRPEKRRLTQVEQRKLAQQRRVLSAALLAMARVRPAGMLSWVESFPEDRRWKHLERLVFLGSALLEAVKRVPVAAAAEQARAVIRVLGWHAARKTDAKAHGALVRAMPAFLRKEVVKMLSCMPWDEGAGSLAVALGRAYPKQSRRLAARREVESLVLIRGLSPKQLEDGGWGREWRKAGLQAWPVCRMFDGESAQPAGDHAGVAWVFAQEDPDRVLLRWLRHRPVRAAALSRHGEETVVLAECLLRSGKGAGMPGDSDHEREFEELLVALRQEEEAIAQRVAVLAHPQHAGPASLAALAVDGKLDALHLQEIDPERLRGMLPVAAALAPERPAVWQALELSLWIGLRWFRYLIRLAVARTAHHRSGGVAGHVFDDSYEVYELPKRSGGKRRITAPRKLLRELQRDVLRRFELETACQPEENAHGFVPGRSTLTNAGPHVGREVVVNIDIRGFFPSTPQRLIQRAVRRVAGDQLSPPVVYLLADLCTHEGALPTGAPTSPWIANLVLAGADKALRKASAAAGVQYTRYADDLTFSGDSRAVGIIRFARKVLGGLGYELDPKKINIFRRGRRQVVTGLVVNERVNLPRQVRRKIRAAVHAVAQGREPSWHGRPVSVGTVRGALGWWHQIHPEQAARLTEVFREATGGKDG